MLGESDFFSADEVKQMMGVTSAEPLGYVVHLEETDEFWAGEKFKQGIHCNVWSVTPELAKKLTFEKAVKVATTYGKNAKVAHLFDNGNQLMISILEKKEP